MFPLFSLFLLSNLVFLLASVPTAYAARNVTIDDSGNELTYDPSRLWQSSPCDGCTGVNPQTEKITQGTFHSTILSGPTGSDTVSVLIPFTGTAVYVYFFLANKDSVAPRTTCNFSIDGEDVNSFDNNNRTGDEDFLYDQLVFSMAGLENRNHSLVIYSKGADRSVFLGFDHAEYTVPDPQDLSGSSAPNNGQASSKPAPPTPVASVVGSQSTIGATTAATAGPNMGIIVGSAVGGGIFLLLLAVVGFLLCRRRRRRLANTISLAPWQPLADTEKQQPSLPNDSGVNVIEKEFSLAKVSSRDSTNSEAGYLPELPIREPKYPRGYAPGGINIPPQAHVRKPSQISPVTPKSSLSRFSSLSGYDILRRTSNRLTSGFRTKHSARSPSSFSISAPRPVDASETRKTLLRELERQLWRLRMEIRDLETERKDVTDEAVDASLQNRIERLKEDMMMVTVQQDSLADAPQPSDGNTLSSPV